ncbi:twin-arginine translocation pathway signal protein [Pseudomonas sp. dw_358]|uniref:YncE family protein n=1 Tax=Pseudomonas sp. dw_358 TaxID=2720083 RepID=UPI002116D2AB|nr:twin-arginine translocation pathway signal protein [Pseudomonas sp. dw_358]
MTPFKRRQILQMMAVTSTLPLIPPGLAADSPKNELVLVEKEAPGVSFYQLPDGKPLAHISMATQPHEIVADAQHRFAYVAQYGMDKWLSPGEGGHLVYVLDLVARKLARTIDLTPYHRLHGIRMDAAGRLYVLSETDSVMIRFDNPSKDEYPSQIVPVGGTRSHYFVLTRDGRRAYVSDTLSGMVIMLDPHDPTFTPVKRLLGEAPEGSCLSVDEKTYYAIDRYKGVLHAFDAATLQPLKQVQLRGEAVRIAALPDGRLIVANQADKSLSLLHAETLAEVAHLPLEAAASGLNLAPAADKVYASLESNEVVIVDIGKWQITGSFATQKAPDAAAVIMRS